MPHLKVLVMKPTCSDHSPLSIKLDAEEDPSPKPFKFMNQLVEHNDFLEVLVGAWNGNSGDHIMETV